VATGSPRLGPDECSNVGEAKRGVERVFIKTAIGDRMLVSEHWYHRNDRLEVVLLTLSQGEPNRSTQRADHGGKLRIDASLRPADRLDRLLTRRVGSVLVKLDVRAIEMAKLPRRIPGKLVEELLQRPLAHNRRHRA